VKKIVVGLVLALLLVGAMTVSAEDAVFASWNQKGHMNIYGSIGYNYWGFDVSPGIEFILGEFNIGPVPFDWGGMARGIVGFDLFSGYGFNWGAGALASLHMGLVWNLDFYAALGLGLAGWYGTPFRFGFASFNGLSYKLSDKFFVLLEGGYIVYTSIWGIGVQMKL
jgi:hypothetical protein